MVRQLQRRNCRSRWPTGPGDAPAPGAQLQVVQRLGGTFGDDGQFGMQWAIAPGGAMPGGMPGDGYGHDASEGGTILMGCPETCPPRVYDAPWQLLVECLAECCA